MQNIFKVNNTSNRRHTGLLLTLNIFDTFLLGFFGWVWTCKCWIEYFIAFKKSKFICLSELHLGALPLSVTTVSNSFQLFPIFCLKELHLRCCIGLELNIVTWSTKIQVVSGYQGGPEKLTLLDPQKIHFQIFFTLTLYMPTIKWSNKLKQFVGCCQQIV